jgi:hypothetical protein
MSLCSRQRKEGRRERGRVLLSLFVLRAVDQEGDEWGNPMVAWLLMTN